ncbi:MAG: hypothetical protein ACPGJS_11260 [Flammeovirgaceae bacterium]
MKHIIIVFVALVTISACSSKTESLLTQKPTLNDYKSGEKWVWKWKSTLDGEVRGEGEDIREVVDYHGALGFWNGFDTIQVSTALKQTKNNTPFRDWPLQVGKKWLFESEWTNESGSKGKTSQHAEIISFEELATTAGKFWAYQIKYQGTMENYDVGGKGEVTDFWWYCPELKTDIKHIQDDGKGFIYTSELISYSKPQ